MRRKRSARSTEYGKRRCGQSINICSTFHTFFFSGESLERLFARGGLTVVHSYSQDAFAAHSTLASRVQKLAIRAIDRLGSLREARYERVMFARA